MNTHRRRTAGLTLLEVLILICVALVLGVVFLTDGPARQPFKSQIEAAIIFTHQEISPALGAYKLNTGRYPTTAEGLQALLVAPPGVAGWNGPYINISTVPLDPWKQPYHYAYPAKHNSIGKYDCWSSGPDGVDGTADDIGNW